MLEALLITKFVIFFFLFFILKFFILNLQQQIRGVKNLENYIVSCYVLNPDF